MTGATAGRAARYHAPVSEDPRSLLTRVPGCDRLDPAALTALAEASRFDRHPEGAVLVAQGDPAPDCYWVIDAGAVRVSRADDGRDETLDVLAAGDVVDPGEPGQPAACSIVAAEALRCMRVPQSAVARHRTSLSVGGTALRHGEAALLVRRVADLVTGPPATCPAAASVAEAAGVMARRGVGSIVVMGADGAPAGILTDRDLRTRVLARGLPSSTAVAAVMSSPLVSLSADRSAFDALLEMTRLGIRHLGVTAGGRLVGVISTHDVLLLQAIHPVQLARDIEAEDGLEGLADAAPRVLGVVRWLAGIGASAPDIGRIAAQLNDRLVVRALHVVVTALEAEGHGRPPVPFAWLAAGSEGRREQTLKTDQDNGLVYEDPPAELAEEAARYFARLAAAMETALERLGFPPCPGGFMASNPRWCRPEAAWRSEFASWMETPRPDHLLDASIFFDLRPLGVDPGPGRRLWEWVCVSAPSHALFLRFMAKVSLERRVPLGLFGRLVVERSGVHKHQLDLKARGVFPMTQAMRVCALSLGARETNTLDRLHVAGERGLFTAGQVGDLRDAWEVVSRLRLGRQLECLDAGQPPDNFIDPETLRKMDRTLLTESFKTLGWLQRTIADRFMTELIA